MAYFDNLLNQFWKRWLSEYLIELRECHCHQISKHNPNPKSPSVGDVVLVYDQDRPRGQWKVAIVEEVITGSDDYVRGAVVRLHSKSGCLTLLRHSVCHLYPLEVSLEPHEDYDVTDTAVRPELLRRSRRAAAKVATDNIRYVQDFLEDEPSPD